MASLKVRKYRERAGAFLVEGADLVAAGMAAGHRPQAVFVLAESAAAAAAATDAALADLDVHVITSRVAAKLTTLETAPEVMAVFATPQAPALEDLVGRALPDGLAVYADHVADPGNMGTLIRAAAAFAAAALIASPGCVDVLAPKVVRASMGAVFALPLYQGVQLREVVRDAGVENVYGLAAHGGVALPDAPLALPAVLCVGAERAGLSADVRRQLTAQLTIPLAPGSVGQVESLNAGVAGAIALYEFARRRVRRGASTAGPAADRETTRVVRPATSAKE